MSKRSDAVKLWRRNRKNKIRESMGGACVVCGYDRCYDALAFHHLNPEEKEKSISYMLSSPASWQKTVEEIRKCVLICNNCHAELHAGMIQLPQNPRRFDESFA